MTVVLLSMPHVTSSVEMRLNTKCLVAGLQAAAGACAI